LPLSQTTKPDPIPTSPTAKTYTPLYNIKTDYLFNVPVDYKDGLTTNVNINFIDGTGNTAPQTFTIPMFITTTLTLPQLQPQRCKLLII
jgi:hypothetical protein